MSKSKNGPEQFGEPDESISTLKAEIADANVRIEELEQLVSDTESERNELARKIESLPALPESHPDQNALTWLKSNCSRFKIQVEQLTGRIVIEGIVAAESKQGGFIEYYVPRVVRANGKPPFQIHQDNTFKQYRAVEFRYIAMDESIAQAVQMLIATYCPGDQKVGTQEFTENREADYGDRKIWVQPVREEYADSLEEFTKLPSALD